MEITRRSLLAAPAFSVLYGKPGLEGVRIGVTDWNLRQTAKVEAIAVAKSLGFEGVEVSLGRNAVDGLLPLADPGVQRRYVTESRNAGIAIAGTCLDILHVNYLKNDKLGQKWVADSIPITKALGSNVILLPFFGKGAIEQQAEQDYVADVLKELAPAAEKAGIVLGLENTISAEANVRIMDRAKSRALKVYYDVGNSTFAGFDIFKEMRFLGRDRICQIHLKDKDYLGAGNIDFPKVAATIAEIGYRGFANLETRTVTTVEDDMRRNLAFIRKVFQAAR